jgi:hypothetical protein
LALWTIIHSWTFDGPAEPGADCDGGMAFTIAPAEGGDERTLSLQYASGGGPPSTYAMRRIADTYLAEAEPPRYVTVDREGKVIRTS